MEERLAYLKCLRDEIISGQRARNTILALKVTVIAGLVSYSLVRNLKLITFSALICVILDYVILGISLMITSISKYIMEHIESSFDSFTGWETHVKRYPGDIRKGRLLASLASGSGLTFTIILASVYGLLQNSSGSALQIIKDQLPFWIILLVSIMGWAISTILQVRIK